MEEKRIEYIRKNGGIAIKVKDDNTGKSLYIRENKGEKCGVLYCGIVPNDDQSVVVGFSLCSKVDKFDYVSGERRPGFGLSVAKSRAEKWSMHNAYFVQNSFTEQMIEDGSNLIWFENPNPEKIVEVPPSVIKRLKVFIERCKRYYKDKRFPAWTEKIRNDNPTSVVEYIILKNKKMI